MGRGDGEGKMRMEREMSGVEGDELKKLVGRVEWGRRNGERIEGDGGVEEEMRERGGVEEGDEGKG
jgi:hypothetical protein